MREGKDREYTSQFSRPLKLMLLGVTDRQMHCPKISIVGRHFGWSDIGSRKENTLYFALAYVPFAACTRSQARGPSLQLPSFARAHAHVRTW